MALKLVTGPAEEPITLAEAKSHCRIDFTDDDTLLAGLIIAARNQAEAITRRALVTQTWDLLLDRFPRQIDVPRAPLLSVTSINYIDDAGVSQLLASTEYKVDANSEPARITEAYGKTWPTTRREINAVTVRFVAGFGAAADVPQAIKQAMLLMIGHWYNNRESVDLSAGQLVEVPQTVDWLLWPYRVITF